MRIADIAKRYGVYHSYPTTIVKRYKMRKDMEHVRRKHVYKKKPMPKRPWKDDGKATITSHIVNGNPSTIASLIAAFGPENNTPDVVSRRLARGWTLFDAVCTPVAPPSKIGARRATELYSDEPWECTGKWCRCNAYRKTT